MASFLVSDDDSWGEKNEKYLMWWVHHNIL
jgi:hypothetical protein